LRSFNAESVDFLRSPAFEWAAQAVLDHGLCTSVGVCVNHPEEAMAAMDVEWVTALQIPVSLVDVRLIDPELLVVYEMKKIRLIARPGFFLEDGSSADSVTEGFWHSLGLFAKRAGMTAHEMSARFIFGNLGKTLDVALLEADHVEPLSNQLRLIAGDKSPLTPELLSGLRPLQDLALKSGRSH
jgi:aryl-alcohol dehydrogenase-like predicted oxidoreductase